MRENVYVLPSYLIDSLPEYSILGWKSLSLTIARHRTSLHLGQLLVGVSSVRTLGLSF